MRYALTLHPQGVIPRDPQIKVKMRRQPVIAAATIEADDEAPDTPPPPADHVFLAEFEGATTLDMYTAENGGPIVGVTADMDGSVDFYTNSGDPAELDLESFDVESGGATPNSAIDGAERRAIWTPTAAPVTADYFVEVGVQGTPAASGATSELHLLVALRGSQNSPIDPDWPDGIPHIGLVLNCAWGDGNFSVEVKRHYYKPDQSHLRTIIDTYTVSSLTNGVPYEAMLKVALSGFDISFYLNDALQVTEAVDPSYPSGIGNAYLALNYDNASGDPLPSITHWLVDDL